jgi:hypothetical protein
VKLIIVLLILFTAELCQAFDIEPVLYNYYEPGSLKIKYTGLRRLIIDESVDFLSNEFIDNYEEQLINGKISFYNYKENILRLNSGIEHNGLNGYWWQRSWYKSRSTKFGGAPATINFTQGRTSDIIDLGIAKVNENFKFKLKEYETDITDRWGFKFIPQITSSTAEIITKASASVLFEYSLRGIKILTITIEAGYKVKIKEFIEFRIEIFNL